MNYPEDELLPLSAIQHLLFCERQCALIHVEQLWDENVLTVEGHQLHEKTDESGNESRGDLRIARGLYIQSLQLGLSGRADVVEFHREVNDAGPGRAITLPGQPGFWRPSPVEYKRGKPKPGFCDEAQVCAQAMCLEEMLKVRIESGALYYKRPRRRKEVQFDDHLRCVVSTAAARLHELIESGITPPAVNDNRCDNCSLTSLCLPTCSTGKRSVRRFVALNLEHLDENQSGKES